MASKPKVRSALLSEECLSKLGAVLIRGGGGSGTVQGRDVWEPDKQFPGRVFNVRVMNCLICVLFIIVIDVMMICTSAAFPAPLWNGLGVGGGRGGVGLVAAPPSQSKKSLAVV